MDVLIGLGCNGALVSKMWHFLWLTLGLDVDKIVHAAAAAQGVGVAAAKGGGVGAASATKGGGAGGSAVITKGVGEQDPIFSVITLCCQTTQYRLV